MAEGFRIAAAQSAPVFLDRDATVEKACGLIATAAAVPDTFTFKRDYLQQINGWINPGHSVIVDPDGKLLAGPQRRKKRSSTRTSQPTRWLARAGSSTSRVTTRARTCSSFASIAGPGR